MNDKNCVQVLLSGAGGLIGSHFSTRLLEENVINPIFMVSGGTDYSDVLPSSKTIIKDLSVEDSVDGLIDDVVDKYGEIDVLINNAAINTENGISSFAQDTSDKRIKDTFQVNAVAPLSMIRQLLVRPNPPHLIVNVLTRTAIGGGKRHIAYYSSKAALLNASRSLSMEYPKTRFVCLMVSQITRKDFNGISVELVGDALLDQILRGGKHKRFEKVFFLKPVVYWKYLLNYCYQLLMNSSNWLSFLHHRL